MPIGVIRRYAAILVGCIAAVVSFPSTATALPPDTVDLSLQLSTEDMLQFVLNVTNKGAQPALDVALTVTLSSGAILDPGTGWSCDAATGTVTCVIPDLDPGRSAMANLTLGAMPQQMKALVASAQVEAIPEDNIVELSIDGDQIVISSGTLTSGGEPLHTDPLPPAPSLSVTTIDLGTVTGASGSLTLSGIAFPSQNLAWTIDETAPITGGGTLVVSPNAELTVLSDRDAQQAAFTLSVGSSFQTGGHLTVKTRLPADMTYTGATGPWSCHANGAEVTCDSSDMHGGTLVITGEGLGFAAGEPALTLESIAVATELAGDSNDSNAPEATANGESNNGGGGALGGMVLLLGVLTLRARCCARV